VKVKKTLKDRRHFIMPTTEQNLRTCSKGHKYYISSDCPTCPTCEEERKPDSGLLSQLSAPARRALENHGIKTAQELSKFSEKEILKLHGMGPASLPKLRTSLENEGLTFRKQNQTFID
jgi:DNA-directed RNA polymerase alpha subunit